jgi:hypothetical protein
MEFDLMQDELFQVEEILSTTLTSVLGIFGVTFVNMQSESKDNCF